MVSVFVDGWCKGNNQKEQKREAGASFAVQVNGTTVESTWGDSKKKVHRCISDAETNNQAEIDAIVQGMLYLRELIERLPGNITLPQTFICSDSKNAIGWVTGEFRVKDKSLIERVQSARDLFDKLAAYEIRIIYVPREKNVEILGH